MSSFYTIKLSHENILELVLNIYGAYLSRRGFVSVKSKGIIYNVARDVICGVILCDEMYVIS